MSGMLTRVAPGRVRSVHRGWGQSCRGTRGGGPTRGAESILERFPMGSTPVPLGSRHHPEETPPFPPFARGDETLRLRALFFPLATGGIPRVSAFAFPPLRRGGWGGEWG